MKSRAKIGTPESIAMLLLASFFDGIQAFVNLLNLIPFVGQILSFIFNITITAFAFIIFSIWFFLRGTAFLSPKKPLKMLTKIGILSSEMLPLISVFPSISISIFMTLADANGPNHFPMSLFSKIPGLQGKVLTKVVGK